MEAYPGCMAEQPRLSVIVKVYERSTLIDVERRLVDDLSAWEEEFKELYNPELFGWALAENKTST
jgi:hypothetical protein